MGSWDRVLGDVERGTDLGIAKMRLFGNFYAVDDTGGGDLEEL